MQALEKEPLLLPVPSVPAQPDISYQWEPLSKNAGEMWPLIVEKSKEVFPDHDKRPPDPDWETYVKLQIDGALHMVTARIDGALAGYILWIISRSLHRKSELGACTDTHYVRPPYRDTGMGQEMLSRSESILREMGCRNIMIHNLYPYSARWLKELGFKNFGSVMIKE